MSNGLLHKYFLNNSDKRLHKWVHYFDIYERHFSRFRGKSPVILELGVMGGGSLAMWKEYFGEDSKIIGIDINPKCKQHEGDGIEVFIGSQDDYKLIDEIFRKYPKIDIVLDDGSHIMKHMITSFELIYEKINPNGVYAVEDTHTCYWNEFDGGYKRQGSFIEFVKNKFDEINAVHTREAIPITNFTKQTDSIVIYDSIVVFEKRKQGIRQAPITAGM
jgi:23S rRNA U2552 (ribose-2'-O)-methylase RlmE/FtsJ